MLVTRLAWHTQARKGIVPAMWIGSSDGRPRYSAFYRKAVRSWFLTDLRSFRRLPFPDLKAAKAHAEADLILR